jgi:uncharacterized membrane protein HdeD (DUF308 family)
MMNEFNEAAKAGGKKMTVFGAVAILLGVLAILTPAVAGTSVLLLLGVIVLAAGIIRIIWAFGSGSVGKGLLMFAIGLLTLLCGIGLIANPLFASGVLTIVLAVYFLLDGLAEIVAALRQKGRQGWGWMLLGGIVSVLLAAVIWKQFPLSGIWAIGVLLGIKLFFVGLIMVTGGSALRQIAKT